MKKLLILSIVLFSFCISFADNHLVYLRFDESTNNVSAIKQQLSRISIATSDTFLLYFDHKIYDQSEFEKLLASKSFLSNLTVYEPVQESRELNSFLDSHIGEFIDNNGEINGKKDKTWKFTFLLPELSSKDDLIRWLDINNFQDRDIVTQFITFDDETFLYTYDLQEFMAQATFMLNF